MMTAATCPRVFSPSAAAIIERASAAAPALTSCAATGSPLRAASATAGAKAARLRAGLASEPSFVASSPIEPNCFAAPSVSIVAEPRPSLARAAAFVTDPRTPAIHPAKLTVSTDRDGHRTGSRGQYDPGFAAECAGVRGDG